MFPCAVLGFGGAFSYFGSQELDPTKLIFGIEPLWAYAAATVAATGNVPSTRG
jgi:mitochondrial import inner membrane translocase subunit TIM23